MLPRLSQRPFYSPLPPAAMLRPLSRTFSQKLRAQRPLLTPPRTLPTPLATIPLRHAHEGTGWNDYGSVPAYESRWIQFFTTEAYDQFELQRGLNACFSYDIIPTVPVLEAALRACRRLNDFSQAVRVFGALREKCKDDTEYHGYVKYLQHIKEELGVPAPEDIGRK